MVESSFSDLDVFESDVSGEMVERGEGDVVLEEQGSGLLGLRVEGVEGVGFGDAGVVAVVGDGAGPVADVVLTGAVHGWNCY